MEQGRLVGGMEVGFEGSGQRADWEHDLGIYNGFQVYEGYGCMGNWVHLG